MTAKQQRFKEHIEKWEGSGLSQAAYCRRYKLNIKQFGYYLRRYKSIDTAPTPRFAEVQTSEKSSLSLSFPGGIILQIEGPVDSTQLREVCEALRC